MKIITNVPDRLYESLKERGYANRSESLALLEYILDGKALPDNEVNDAMGLCGLCPYYQKENKK